MLRFQLNKKGLALTIIFFFLTLAGCKEEKKVEQPPEEVGVNPAESFNRLQITDRDREDIVKLKSYPEELKFGNVPEQQLVERTIGITNIYKNPITIKNVKLYGAENLYKVSGNCTTGLQLEQDGRCELTVQYIPLDGTTHDGEILVTYEAGKPLSINVSGHGITPEAKPIDPAFLAAFEYSRKRQTSKIKINKTEAPEETESYLQIHGKLQEYPNSMYKGGSKTVSTPPVDRSRIITQDRYIPAVLENTISSEIPGGRIIAVVERNVYGSDGRKVLIPGGSRVVGSYGALTGVGIGRLAVSWNRIIRPDGVSIAISGDGADPMGRLGLIGDVDRKFFQKYGSAVLLSLLGIMPEYFFGEGEGTSTGNVGEGGIVINSGDKENSLSSTASATQQFTQDMSALAQQIIQENIQIQPVITIPQGTRILIIPAQDIYLIHPDQFVTVEEVEKPKSPFARDYNENPQVETVQSSNFSAPASIIQKPVSSTLPQPAAPVTFSETVSKRLYNPGQ